MSKAVYRLCSSMAGCVQEDIGRTSLSLSVVGSKYDNRKYKIMIILESKVLACLSQEG